MAPMNPSGNSMENPMGNPMGNPMQEVKRCYGCGEIGHTVHMCRPLQEFVQKGIVRQNERGRYVMQSGAPIYRATFGEPLVTAIKRILTPASNFIAVNTMPYEAYLQDVYVAHEDMDRKGGYMTVEEDP